MRYKIEKNTVQETLIIPLYARKMCSELYPNLYRDEAARRLMNAVDYDFSALQKKSHKLMQQFGFLEAAMRQNDLAYEVREYLKSHPNAAVVNLAAGWTAPAAPATTDTAKSTIWTFRMSSRCATSCSQPGIGRKISPATSTIHRGLRESTPPAARSFLRRECSTIS